METILKILMEDPNVAMATISAYVTKYKPLAYGIGNELLLIMKDYVDNDEIFNVAASLKKKQYDAYVSVGFTEEQAIAFIINDNLKLIHNIKNNSNRVSTNKK